MGQLPVLAGHLAPDFGAHLPASAQVHLPSGQEQSFAQALASGAGHLQVSPHAHLPSGHVHLSPHAQDAFAVAVSAITPKFIAIAATSAITIKNMYFLFIFVFLMLIVSCEKNELPTLLTVNTGKRNGTGGVELRRSTNAVRDCRQATSRGVPVRYRPGALRHRTPPVHSENWYSEEYVYQV